MRNDSTLGGADDIIGAMFVELSPGNADDGSEVVVGSLVADARQALHELDRRDVLGARAFLAPAFGIGHLLAFPQFFEADALDSR